MPNAKTKGSDIKVIKTRYIVQVSLVSCSGVISLTGSHDYCCYFSAYFVIFFNCNHGENPINATSSVPGNLDLVLSWLVLGYV